MSHVLLLPSWYPGSPNDVKGVFFRDQALALADAGHRVGVVAPGMRSLRTVGQGSSARAVPEYELDAGIPTYRSRVWAALPRVPYGNYWLWRRAAERLLKRYLVEQGKPDVIHAHAAIYAGAMAADWGERLSIPVVLTEHSSAFARGIFRPWQLRLARKAAQRAAERIAVSPEFARLLGERLGHQSGGWQWIPNIVARRFFGATAARVDRDAFESPRLLNLAGMNNNKGQSDLIQAFANAFPSPSGVELWLGGDGPIRARLQQEAAQAGIADRVSFLGAVPPDEVPGLLAQIDLMVVASHYETFGVVAAEALMAGVPVVATRCGGPECIVGEGDGVLVAPRDPGALAAALAETVERLPSYEPMGIAARANKRFSGPAVARQLGEVYERVLAGGTTR